MLRNNLATRPFYNESGVRLLLVALALLVAVATIANVALWMRYSSSDTNLAARADADESTARELRASAKQLQSTIDPAQIQATSIDANQANALIGRRTFSWTEVFNQFEAAIPANVRITAVRQRVDQARGSVLTIGVQGREVDEVHAFMDNLESTGFFTEVLALDEAMGETGEVDAVLETLYRPRGSQPAVSQAAPARGRADR
jgi:Tfp pilus assembly protein PilN